MNFAEDVKTFPHQIHVKLPAVPGITPVKNAAIPIHCPIRPVHAVLSHFRVIAKCHSAHGIPNAARALFVWINRQIRTEHAEVVQILLNNTHATITPITSVTTIHPAENAEMPILLPIRHVQTEEPYE